MSLTKRESRLIKRIAYAMKLERSGDNGIKDCLDESTIAAALSLLVKITRKERMEGEYE